MATKHDYLGSDWIMVDLHLHTPGVNTFKLPSGTDINNDKEKIVIDYVNKLKQSGIKLGAITDYNGIRNEWFELIRSKAKEQGIVILPGTELSLTAGKYGLHLLLILEESIDIDGFNRFLHSLDKNPEKPLLTDREHRDINARYELEELVNEIRNRYNCLVIFAHPENGKGLLNTFSPREAAKYISLIKPDALEYFSEDEKNRLISTGEIKKELLEKIAIIESSDPKSIDEIGTKPRDEKSRVTYIKLSELSLKALKLALHDPEVRVKLYQKPEMYHSRIKRVVIKGTTFLKDVEISLSPELNTFIGGRGVGKSAIIESIRYCLDLPIYAEAYQKEPFVSAVLGSGGEVSVEIEKYYGNIKRLYEIRRVLGKEPEVYDENKEKVYIKPTEIFEKDKIPIIIGQKELFNISQDEKFLLQLIDQFIGETIRTKQKEFENSIQKLNENGKKIIELEEVLAKKDDYEQQLKSINSKIKEYETLGVAQKLERYTKILEDDEKISRAKEKIETLIHKIEEIFKESVQELSEITESLKGGKSEKKEILEKFAKETENLISIIKEAKLVEDLQSIYKKTLEDIINQWTSEKGKVEKEIEEVRKKLGEEKLRPENLEYLTRQKTKLEALLKEFSKYEDRLKSAKRVREELKQKIKEIRYELFKIREEKADEINEKLKGKVKIKVTYEGERKKFKSSLSNLLQGSGIQKNAIDSILETNGIPVDGILISEFLAEGKEKLTERFKLTEKMAERFMDWFKDKNKLFELETLFPDDLIEIELNVDGKYIPLSKLSPGQKATALLLIMFIMENRILVLDQPEEDLDNRFIYEDVVNILRSLKGKMQIITATHNANIPVIGDSELIVVLDKYEDKCRLIYGGSIDKESIREQVKRIMEGGEEAFLRRAEKYGGIR